jgi:hypothetical protein
VCLEVNLHASLVHASGDIAPRKVTRGVPSLIAVVLLLAQVVPLKHPVKFHFFGLAQCASPPPFLSLYRTVRSVMEGSFGASMSLGRSVFPTAVSFLSACLSYERGSRCDAILLQLLAHQATHAP